MTKRRADARDAAVGRNIRVPSARPGHVADGARPRAIGITFQQVQKYEKGVNRVGSGRLVRIAAALGVPVARLLAGIDGTRKGEASSPVSR